MGAGIGKEEGCLSAYLPFGTGKAGKILGKLTVRNS